MQMHWFSDVSADVLARQLLSWLRRRVEPGSREWLDALTAESECVDDGWQRLRWALGAVPLLWTINKRRRMNEPTRGTTRARIVRGVANIAAIAGGYAVTIPATYAATHVFRCHLFFGNQPGDARNDPFVFGSIASHLRRSSRHDHRTCVARKIRSVLVGRVFCVQRGGSCLVPPLRHRRLASVRSDAVGDADGGGVRRSSGRDYARNYLDGDSAPAPYHRRHAHRR